MTGKSRLLTDAEYQEVILHENIHSADGKMESTPSVIFQSLIPQIEAKKEIHYLMHPDKSNSLGTSYTGPYMIEFGGQEFKLKIVDGIISTNNVDLKAKLMMQGFVFMYSRNPEDLI
jgi:Ca2+-binding EF-hand superfamily protein